MILCMGLGDERRLDDRGSALLLPDGLVSNEAASSASAYQFKSPERERAGEREGEIRARGGSTNLGRSSEAPENIGHWPISSLRRKEDLLCVKIELLI